MNNQEAVKEPQKEIKKEKKPVNKKKIFGIVVLLIGLVTLAAGIAFMLISKSSVSKMQDAEFLVQIGAWQREDEPTVIWDFTEVGKGELTTNFYVNKYDFIWALEDNNIKIETDWLYTMNDKYSYELDQNNNILTLKKGDETTTFVPAAEPLNESTE